MRNALPVLTVLIAILAIWYVAVAPMNIRVALDQAQRGGAVLQPETALERQEVSVWSLMLRNPAQITQTYAMERPRLPTPVQVATELWSTTGEMALNGRAMSKRSLIYHGWITLHSTLWGFALG
ncbi:MAG: ABC transporter permease, partial [Paracoccaceae bacterium]|nr:ABC transporter permease [Paracoccaceae bacterium]